MDNPIQSNLPTFYLTIAEGHGRYRTAHFLYLCLRLVIVISFIRFIQSGFLDQFSSNKSHRYRSQSVGKE